MIKIICVGKIKYGYLKDAIADYTKRISKYVKIEIIELNDYDYGNDVNKTLKMEYDNIMKIYNSKDYNILLDISSNELNSIEFSKKISDISIINSNITFIIGGSYGIYSEFKDKCNYIMSFSKLTFPHQLFRVMLLEQIYRSFKIINNEEYHK